MRQIPRFCSLLIAMLLLAACASPAKLYGTIYYPPKPAPAFTLTDQHGASFSLLQTRGNPVAMYFGFTHCKDICPQTLAALGKAVQASGTKAKIIFISVDPKHDTPRAVNAFIARVGVKAIGLTGTHTQLAAVWRAYGVTVEPHANDITHSDIIYFIDASGRIRVITTSFDTTKHFEANLRALAP